MKLEWKNEYCLGNDRVDRQHKRLFKLAQSVCDANDQDTLRACVMELYSYTRTHFADEESLMREVNFPGYQNHVEMHNNLIERLNDISQSIGVGQWVQQDIHAFMSKWLLGHIAQEDIKIVECIREQSPVSPDQNDHV